MRFISRRLNAWQRLAVVLTVLWVFGGTYYFWIGQVDANYSEAALNKSFCEEAAATAHDSFLLAKCAANYNQDMMRYGNERFSIPGTTFGILLIEAAAFWLAIWVIFRTVRWILAGRAV